MYRFEEEKFKLTGIVFENTATAEVARSMAIRTS